MYLEFFGLKENPFNVTSDPDFLYLSHTHQEALNHLLYGIHQKKGFVELTGEIGAGKTTLCRALLTRLGDDTKTSLIFNSSLPEGQLLEAVLEDFGIVPERRNKVTFLRQLNEFLLDQLDGRFDPFFRHHEMFGGINKKLILRCDRLAAGGIDQ